MTINANILERAVSELSATCKAWNAKAGVAFDAALDKQHLTRDSILQAGAKAHAAAGLATRDEIHGQLNDLCDYYLFASDAERLKVRELADGNEALLRHLREHIGWSLSRITSPSDAREVRRGLAAASIEQNQSDFRDTYIAFGELYLKAVAVGIDPDSEFEYVSSISSSVARNRSGNMRDFLGKFKQSAFFASYVKPKLGAST
jgi:hypothetical protein